MKKVRLFAVAAAMGMFASVVNAAEVTSKPADTSKTVTTVELSGGEEIIRAEFGGVIVAPTLNVSAYQETRTTKLPSNYATLGGKGYVGFTNEVAVDNNRDGIADTAIWTWNADSTLTGDSAFWFYNDTKTFPTLGTVKYYLGQTETGVGGRLLAPNQAKNDGYIMVENVKNAAGDRVNYHGFYPNTVAGVEQVIGMLVTAGKIEEVKTDDKVIGYRTTASTTKDTAGATDFEKSLVATASYFELTIADADPASRDKLGDIQYAMVNLLAGHEEYADELNSNVRKVTVNYNHATNAAGFDGEGNAVAGLAAGTEVLKLAVDYTIAAGSIATGAYVDDALVLLTSADTIPAGSVVIIDGNGQVLKVLTSATAAVTVADKAIYNDFRSSSRITVVRSTVRYGLEEVDSFKPVKLGNVAVYDAVYEAATETFMPVYDTTLNAAVALGDADGLDTPAKVNAWIRRGAGLYKVNTPANPTSKYLFMFDLGTYDFELGYDFVSTTKKTMTFSIGGSEVTYAAEKIGTNWYPVFETVAEFEGFLETVARFGVATTGRAAAFTGTRTWANGDTQKNYVPLNGLDAASAKQLTFASERKAVDAATANVVVTNNAASIPNNQFGVHDLVYTAKVGDQVVATKTTKVVIAPKYQRVYKNGKVVDLKAFHLNGELYAHYTYDYAKNSVTAVYYKQDGLTVESTVSNKIQ